MYTAEMYTPHVCVLDQAMEEGNPLGCVQNHIKLGGFGTKG